MASMAGRLPRAGRGRVGREGGPGRGPGLRVRGGLGGRGEPAGPIYY